jgi:hypothetical protein
MKNKFSLKTVLVAAAVGLGLALTASALPITPVLLDQGSLGNSGDATEIAWATAAIATYNAANNPDLPALPATMDKQTLGGSEFEIDVTAQWAYLFLKWGGPKDAIRDQVYFVPAGDWTFPAPDKYGLSHRDIWTGPSQPTPPVPDSGATLALLGVSIMALAGLRRRFAN